MKNQILAIIIYSSLILIKFIRSNHIKIENIKTFSGVNESSLNYVMGIKAIDKDILAIGLATGTIIFRNITSGKIIKSLIMHEKSYALEFLNHDTLISSSGPTITLWNTTNYSEIKTFKGLLVASSITCLKLLTNKTLASGWLDKTIQIWNLTDGRIIQTLTGHNDDVRSLIVLNNGTLVSGSGDTTIKLWNTTNGTLIKTLEGHVGAITCLVLINNESFASGSEDKSIKIWNSTTGNVINTLKGHSAGIRSLLLLNEYTLVSGSDDGALGLWNLVTSHVTIKEKAHKIIGFLAGVESLEKLENGLFASGASNIKIWSYNFISNSSTTSTSTSTVSSPTFSTTNDIIKTFTSTTSRTASYITTSTTSTLKSTSQTKANSKTHLFNITTNSNSSAKKNTAMNNSSEFKFSKATFIIIAFITCLFILMIIYLFLIKK